MEKWISLLRKIVAMLVDRIKGKTQQFYGREKVGLDPDGKVFLPTIEMIKGVLDLD